MDKWIKKMSIYMFHGTLSRNKKKEILPFGTTCMDLEGLW